MTYKVPPTGQVLRSPRGPKLLSEIIEAPTRKDAKLALEVFREEYGSKYPRRWPSSTVTGRR
jgi:hypothetical protein